MSEIKDTREIKDFHNVTNIRKITQQCLAPVIAKLQGHIQNVINESHEARTESLGMKTLIESMTQHKIKSDQHTLLIENLTQKLNNLCGHHENLKKQSFNNKDMFAMEIETLKRELKGRQQKISELMKLNADLKRSFTDYRIESKSEIDNLQLKLNDVYKDTLSAAFEIRNKYKQFENTLQITKGQFQASKSKFIEANNKLELYLSEREDIAAKMQHLYNHIFGHVSIDEFQKYKKYQSIELQLAIQKVEQILDNAIPTDARDFVQKAAEQTAEIKKMKAMDLEYKQKFNSLDEKMRQRQEQNAKLRIKVLALEYTVEEKEKQLNKVDKNIKNIQNILNDKVDTAGLNNIIIVTKSVIFQRVSEEITNINKTINNFIKQRKREIYESVLGLIPNQETAFWDKLKFAIPHIQSIQIDVERRCENITQLANNLHDTLEKFSNRITKIKTDLQLKNDAICLDMKNLKKLKDQYQRRYLVVGKILACQSEIINIILSMQIHAQSLKKRQLRNHSNQVFVSFHDGMVFQFPNTLTDEFINYRRKNINKLDLGCCALTCHISFLDSLFQEEFLGWSKYKPSNLFRVNMIEQLEHQRNKLDQNLDKTIQLISHFPPPGQHFLQEQLPIQSLQQKQKPAKEDSLEIFTKTADLRHRSYNKLKKIGERYSGAHTSRMKSGRLTNHSQY